MVILILERTWIPKEVPVWAMAEQGFQARQLVPEPLMLHLQPIASRHAPFVYIINEIVSECMESEESF